MEDVTKSRTKFTVPRGPRKRRGRVKWVLFVILLIAAAGAYRRDWLRFQFQVAMTKIGETGTRAKSLRWFIENDPEKASPVFFDMLLEEPELRRLAVEGLLSSDQQELIPVYISLWQDKNNDPALRDVVLELIADYGGKRGFFVFSDPAIILSPELGHWALAYDYLNANASPDLIDFLVSRYYSGNLDVRRASVTALAYLKDNAVSEDRAKLRSLLADAIQSTDQEMRFRALQAFGAVASLTDIPDMLLLLDEEDTSVSREAGRILRHLGAQPASEESPGLRELKQLAAAASEVEAKGYPQEIVQQLGHDTLMHLWGLVLWGDQTRAGNAAAALTPRVRQVLDDIATARFVSIWNRYEYSTLPTWALNRGQGNMDFGVTVSPDAGKINYAQILAMGVGRVIYVADAQKWSRDYQNERKKFMQHRDLAQHARLQQVVRVEISEAMLKDSAAFSTAFGHILNTTRQGEGAKTGFFEIGLKRGIDPIKSYSEYAALFREAAISAKRMDQSIRLLAGPVPLGDRRWYGPKGAIERLMIHSFGRDEQFRDIVGGVSVSADLQLSDLETEVAEFKKSLQILPGGALLWCTGLSQPTGEAKATITHLERDFLRSAGDASELPGRIAVLAAAGTSAIFFDPLKDAPLTSATAPSASGGLLQRDCMPKPVYHVGSFVVRTLQETRLTTARRQQTGPEGGVVLFPGGPRLVAIAWTSRDEPCTLAGTSLPFVKVTPAAPDSVGNLRSVYLEAAGEETRIPLGKASVVIEEVNEKPASCVEIASAYDRYVFDKLKVISQPIPTCQRSYGSYDRSEGNDDGFSGASSYLYRKQNGEYVIFDARGPGVINRLWLGRLDSISRIRFYYDEAKQPQIDMTPEELFAGRELPFKYPLAASGESGGGGSILLVPLWFSKRLVIATVGIPRFCQVDYSLFDNESEVVSSTAESLRSHTDDLAALTAHFSQETSAIHVDCAPYSVVKSVNLPPGQKVEALSMHGPAVIQCLRAGCENPEQMSHVILQIHWDGAQTAGIGSPLADIFGQKHGMRHWQGHSAGFMQGEGYIHYPMPFAKSARVVLTNTSSATAKVSLSIASSPAVPSETKQRYLCCHWKTAIAAAGQGVRLLSVSGAGRFVGCVLSMYSRGTLSYLDSDILVFADDELRPVIHSTGIDDYFGGANFYEKGLFNLPYCGLLAKKDATTVQYRFNVLDAIAFERSFSFQLEELPPGVRQTVFSGAFFWYSESPAGGDQP